MFENMEVNAVDQEKREFDPDTTEKMSSQNLDSEEMVLEPEYLEQTEENDISPETETGDDIADALGLTPEEKQAFQAIGSEIQALPVEGTNGSAKVRSDCISTTCTYTTVTYYCTYTK